MRAIVRCALIGASSFALLGMCENLLKGKHVAPIERLKVRFYAGDKLPEPADILSTGAWYLLNHISSGLVAFDPKVGQFTPFLAKSWKIEGDGIYTFELSDQALFHDGTPIRAEDVEATLKRILIKKTSTHFHLWEYLKGCDQLTSLNDDCPGMEVVSDKVIRFHMKFRMATFLLQLATPETGIWAKTDIDPQTLEIRHTKFSGPYFVEKMDSAAITLKRNDFSPLFKDFPNAPKVIEAVQGSSADIEDRLVRGEVDAVVRNEKPMNERDWKSLGLEINRSAPSSIIYLHSVDPVGKHQLVGKKFVKEMWKVADQANLTPAISVLPFKERYTIDESTVLKNLPDSSAAAIRVAIPDTGFFSDKFLNFLSDTAMAAGVKLTYVKISFEEYARLFNQITQEDRFDYALGVYSANERFPAVQLRFMTGKRGVQPPVDLKSAESPDMGQAEIDILKKYQEWLIKKGFLVPLFFSNTVVIHKPDKSIGKQRFTAGEVELWRFHYKDGEG